MSPSELPKFQDELFQLQSSVEDGDLILRFKGSAELHVSDVLGSLLSDVHESALRLEVKRVRVDFCELQFMNSSCFKRFVTWLNQVQDGSATAYAIAFRSNPRIRWQKASLAALSCFAPNLVTVETIASA